VVSSFRCMNDSTLHPSGVTKLSTSFSWCKDGNVTSARWQVTLCDPIWRVSKRSVRISINVLSFTVTFLISFFTALYQLPLASRF